METVKTPKIAAPVKTEPQPQKKINLLGLRANTPTVLRAIGLILLAVTVIVLAFAFLRKKEPDFEMISGLPQLSKDVVGVVNGYERRETEGDIVKYFVKADKATTYSDNHQELENALIQVYDEKGETFDSIASQKALVIPNPNDSKIFTAHFVGNVNIQSRDGLNVKTEALSYDKQTEIANTEQPIEFSRENISGKSVGAVVKSKEKQLELKKDVQINGAADPSLEKDEIAKAKLQSFKMVSGKALVLQTQGRIELEQNVFINLIPLGGSNQLQQPTDIKGDKAVAKFVEKEIKSVDMKGNVEVFAKPVGGNPKYTKTNANHALVTIDKEVKRVDLNENVYIETTENSTAPTKINAQNAVYYKPEEKFDLTNNVQIITTQDNKPTTITSQQAIYEQTSGVINLNGGGQIVQGNDLVKGDQITAQLYPNKKLQTAVSRGNAYLKQTTPERTTEVSSAEMTSFYNGAGQVERAVAANNANVTIVPSNQQEYAKTTLSAPKNIELLFRPTQTDSILTQMQTEGRTTITMNAPPNNPKATNKRLIADQVKTYMNQNGKDLTKAEAVGNAEMYVDPQQNAPENYQTTITAPRFDCDFYETGNNPRLCVGKTNAKAVMTPTVPADNRGVRTITSEVLNTTFSAATHNAEQMEAVGNAKFTELDRNGIANRFVYTASDETVRLRDGEPTVWDSRARAKASEIDWDTKNQKSFLRGGVSTTYYSQKQTNGATPFAKTNSPVNVTAESAQFDHARELGIYTGNARAWQDNNYVRADELVMNQKEQRMDGQGKVQSLLYNATRRENGKTTTEPAYVSSNKITYTDKNKQLQYRENVDIRQATDRITAGIADIYMTEKNDVKQTIAQENVVITQPNRKFKGNFAQYTPADETVILKGNPAVVEDAEQGTSQGSQFTVAMRENRVVNQGTANGRAGRTRTTYKIKNQE
jgi:LPS export ABC transporter protein LptC